MALPSDQPTSGSVPAAPPPGPNVPLIPPDRTVGVTTPGGPPADAGGDRYTYPGGGPPRGLGLGGMTLDQMARATPPPRSPFLGYGPRREGWGSNFWPIDASGVYPGNQVSPMLPSPREALPLIAGIGQRWSQFGSPAVAGPAGLAGGYASQLVMLADLASKGQFSQNMLRAQLGRMKLFEEQTAIQSQLALDNHREELLAYDKVFNAARYGGDPPEVTRNKIRALARRFRDDTVEHILDNKDVAGVEAYLQAQDKDFRTLWAASEATTKSSKTAAEDPYTNKTNADGVAPTPLPGATKPEEVTGAGPITGATPGENVLDPILRSGGPGGFNLNSAGVELAHNMLNGQEPKGKEDVPAFQGALRMQHALEKIAQDRSLSAEQKLQAIGKIDPRAAENIRSYGDYVSNPKSYDHPGVGRYLGWTHMVYDGRDGRPRYKDDLYDTAKKYRDMGSPFGRVMARFGGIPEDALRVFQSLQGISETDSGLRRAFELWVTKNLSPDDKYAQLFNNTQALISDMAGIQRGTGTATLGQIQARMKHMVETNSPAQYRVQIGADIADILGRYEYAKEQWNRETGQPGETVPGFSPSGYRVMTSLLRGNMHTGEMPTDVENTPQEVMAVSKKPVHQSWMNDFQKLPPLSVAQMHQMDDQVRLNQGSSDPKVQAQVQWLRQYLFAHRVHAISVEAPPTF